MVCDRSYLASLSQSAYMCGYVLAGCFAFLSDKFGRRPMILICCVIEVIAYLSCAFSINITQYIISRLFQSLGGIGREMGFNSFGK